MTLLKSTTHKKTTTPQPNKKIAQVVGRRVGKAQRAHQS